MSIMMAQHQHNMHLKSPLEVAITSWFGMIPEHLTTKYGARVTPTGFVLDPSCILISKNATTYNYYPAVAWGGTRYFVVWGIYYTSPYALYGRFVNTNGTFASDTIRLATGSGSIFHTHLAFDGTNYFVIWVESSSSTTNVLKGIIVSGSGTPITSPFTIAASASRFKSARVVFNGTHYFVVWQSGGLVYELWGIHYTTNGTPIGSEFRITPTTYTCSSPDVIPGANNRYLNVWTEFRTSYDIYANLDIEMIGIEEENKKDIAKCYLKSTLIKNRIELVNTKGEAKILDIQGRYMGNTKKGIYDCSKLKNGVYFVRLDSGRIFKVIKIK